jgi:phage-related protein|tara:strand:+ start:148 stop:543 length:396 start_codon:yes stop_codon:yes gene_type:complete
MAIGFKDLSDTQRIPDKTMSKATQPRVLKATFGDGYEQRIKRGINNLGAQTYGVTFNTRTKEEIDAIISFFESKAGVDAFEFVFPYSGTGVAGENITESDPILVICESWNQSFDYDDFYSCSATFKRVYNL